MYYVPIIFNLISEFFQFALNVFESETTNLNESDIGFESEKLHTGFLFHFL